MDPATGFSTIMLLPILHTLQIDPEAKLNTNLGFSTLMLGPIPHTLKMDPAAKLNTNLGFSTLVDEVL